MLPKPQISQPYSSMGLMTLLNRSNCNSSGKFRILILRSSEKTAIFAWSAICFFARVKEPLRPRNTPNICIPLQFLIYRGFKMTSQPVRCKQVRR